MLADKSVLATTMILTFVSGGATGYALHGGGNANARPYAVETVFAQQITELREEKGYSEAEIAEAKTYYADYLSEYQRWWDDFTASHADNLDRVEERMRQRLTKLDEKHLGGGGAK